MDAYAHDEGSLALGRGLRFAAVFLLLYGSIVPASFWNDLLGSNSYRLTSWQAIQVLFDLLRGSADEKYQRLYVLLATAALSMGAALLLATCSWVLDKRANRQHLAIEVAPIAIGLVLLSLPAHLPFILPHTPAFGDDGALLRTSEYSRAYRDGLAYCSSSTLLLAIVVLASARVDERTKFATTGLALLVVMIASMPYGHHWGSRTESELIAFFLVLMCVFVLSWRMQRAMRGEQAARGKLEAALLRESDVRTQAEQALQLVREERARYEEQSEAAFVELRSMLQRVEAREQRHSGFLAAAAHDLRQPLTASLLYCDMLAHALRELRARRIIQTRFATCKCLRRRSLL